MLIYDSNDMKQSYVHGRNDESDCPRMALARADANNDDPLVSRNNFRGVDVTL